MLELTVESQATYTRLVGEIQEAIQNQDEDKFDLLKAELGEHIKNNKLADLIRII